MTNPENIDITVQTVTIVDPVNLRVSLTYSQGTNTGNNNGNVSVKEGQGAPTSVITYGSSANGWTVCGIAATAPVPGDISFDLDSAKVVITDSDTATSAETFNFRIQVTNGTTVYTSQDPAVTNEPN